MSAARRPVAALAGAALAALPLGCGDAAGDGAAAAEVWPTGTVLAVDGLALTEAEVDEVAGWLALVVPTATAPEHRRRALTLHLFPKLTVDARFPAERAEALAAAREAFDAARAGAPPTGEVHREPGAWDSMGVEVWAALRDAPEREWVGPIAGIGRFVVARWLERAPGATAADEYFDLELIDFPFAPPGTDRDAVGAWTWEAELTVVDPAWERLVPLAWRAHMLPGDDPTETETVTPTDPGSAGGTHP